MGKLMVGWTTVENAEDAERIARALIEQKLVACVQVDSPIQSYYRWKGETHQTTEFRLKIKFPADKEARLIDWLKANHPYEVPQWFAMEANALPAYLNWAIESTEG